MTLEIMQVLVASTGHVTEAEAKLFDAPEGKELPGNMSDPMNWQYGWQFYIGKRGECVTTDGLSPGLARVFEIAWDNQIEWVRFDSDGPVVDDALINDW